MTITTPDGTADAYFVHPATGTAPGILVWPDIFGLRPAFRQMGKRLAESGYSVLVVNQFYRVKKPPIARARLANANSGVAAARAGAERDDAHDGREGVHRVAGRPAVGGEEPQDRDAGLLHGRPDGVPHLCSGAGSRRRGRLVPWRLASSPSQPNSPHLQASKTKAQFLIAIASNDDQRSPNEKDVLKETFEKANLPAEIEVYAGAHGWCPPDSTRLQRAGCRKGLDATAGAVRQGAPVRRECAAIVRSGRIVHATLLDGLSPLPVERLQLADHPLDHARPPCQNFGSRASRPNGLSSSE